jgi:broad specificity phosphatase PhoE
VATTIVLARHGETDWNRARRVQGHADVPLNAAGRRQAADLVARLAHETFDAVYTSDLRRASETALLVAEPRGLDVVPATELRERDFGTWEGLTDDEARRRYPVETEDPRWWGDAETQEEMATRVVQKLIEIGRVHRGGRVLVVSHGGPLRAMLRHVGRDPHGPIDNCAVVRFVAEGGTLRGVD